MNRDYRMADNKLNFDRPLLSVRRRVAPSRAFEETKTGNLTHRIPAHRSELKSGPVRNPGVVPFVWERTPGQPKEDVRRPTVFAPKLPPGRNVESSKEEATSSDSGESEEAYADARDTLSRTESFSLNCSTSGLSGQVGFPGSISTEVHAREFMMDKFLPAAKAMASETTPQYLTRNQNVVVQEKSQRVKESVNRYIKPSLRYGPSFAKRYAQYQEKDDEEEETDDGYDHPQDLSLACGLLPRFCVRGSLCIINPVPAMSVRSRSRKLVDKVQTAELDVEKMKSRRNELGSLERRHSTGTRGDALLSCQEAKEVFAIPEVRKHAGAGTKGFGSDGKGSNAFEESNSESPIIEKTLYVDTIQLVESLNLDQSDSSHEDFQKLKTTNRDEGLLPDAFSIFCSTDKPNEKCGMEFAEDRALRPDSTGTETEATEEGLEKHHQNYSQHPVPPPLPKSPSDSWLFRTLPSVATKRSSLRSYTQNQFPKASASDAKSETILTTTNVQHRHLHYPEVPLTTISET